MNRRRAILIIFLSALLWTSHGRCEPVKRDTPDQLFYQGNAYYKEGNYTNALLAYDKILGSGSESANLYYNIGNSFFKLNKLGYAILFYERARRLMPYDSDLKSNISFARSLAGEESYEEMAGDRISKAMKRPFRNFALGELASLALIIYIFTVLLIGFSILNPIAGKRIRLILALDIVICIYTVTVFGMRYYGEEVVRYGIVLTKAVECKYEPIDKSSTYFKLQEGGEVEILATHDGWKKVRRADGKVGWVKKDAVEAI